MTVLETLFVDRAAYRAELRKQAQSRSGPWIDKKCLMPVDRDELLALLDEAESLRAALHEALECIRYDQGTADVEQMNSWSRAAYTRGRAAMEQATGVPYPPDATEDE